ncbi:MULTISPECIES: ferrochelatase [Corynebacterium]|jgi:ferrochelatase|uniref:ferrochelatase n=1 Tax=Corynebacterium TaxID=1716 RepID=UPI0010327925|nr:ferrochelatase [Corynebacterium neomassiliense]MCI1257231.1 ferrochelatase [Corynebacterium provencense]
MSDPDAVLLLSFGGPEKAGDVIPFLENVTRGRGIPRSRLEVVGEHYRALGGRSPLNDLNRELIANIRRALAARGHDLPVYFGNRNWHPMVEDAVARMTADGVRDAVVFATSAWGGYSGCRQYHEDIARARQSVLDRGDSPPRLRRLRHFHDHPRFIAAFAHSVDSARRALGDAGADADLVFTAHSVPLSADRQAGPPDAGGHLYSRQVRDSARLIRAASSFAPGGGPDARAVGDPCRDDSRDVELVWQSRSGPPAVPWLGPDICDHLRDRVAQRNRRPVVLCPVGFISDHVEVIWDLDTEAREVAAELGIRLSRAATPGPTPDFADMVVDLVEEQTEGSGRVTASCGTVPNFGSAVDGAPCTAGCCGA